MDDSCGWSVLRGDDDGMGESELIVVRCEEEEKKDDDKDDEDEKDAHVEGWMQVRYEGGWDERKSLDEKGIDGAGFVVC